MIKNQLENYYNINPSKKLIYQINKKNQKILFVKINEIYKLLGNTDLNKQ